MARFNKYDLNYLHNRPEVIYWKVIAAAHDKHGQNRELSILEDHDLIFDEYDAKIRKLPV